MVCRFQENIQLRSSPKQIRTVLYIQREFYFDNVVMHVFCQRRSRAFRLSMLIDFAMFDLMLEHSFKIF